MNPYLAKLKTIDYATPHPQVPSKPSKPSFEGFEGGPSRCFSKNERAASAVERTPFGHFGCVFEVLRSRCPDWVPVDRWQQCVEDGRRFLMQWRGPAEVFGWTARDLFGLASVPDDPGSNYLRLSRHDEIGLIWLLCGRPVLALTESTAAIESATGTVTIYRRHNKPAVGPLGDSLDDLL